MLKFVLNDKTDKIFPLQQFMRFMCLGAVLPIRFAGRSRCSLSRHNCTARFYWSIHAVAHFLCAVGFATDRR